MDLKKEITFERKNKEGFVIETPYGSIEVVLNLKFNRDNRFNGRTAVTVSHPEIESINVYRIDFKGKPQNKKTKDFIHGNTKEGSEVRSI